MALPQRLKTRRKRELLGAGAYPFPEECSEKCTFVLDRMRERYPLLFQQGFLDWKAFQMSETRVWPFAFFNAQFIYMSRNPFSYM